MKKYLLFCLFSVLYFFSISQTATSVANGNWLNPMTWDCICIPTPGYYITINHNVSMDTDFAYANGFIFISASGSLIQNISTRNLWVYGTGYLTNNGTLTVHNILYEGNDGSLLNYGNINAGNIHLTTGLTNYTGAVVNTDSLFNNESLLNYGTINVIAITNNDVFANSEVMNFTDFTNNGAFHNSGGIIQGSNNMWNHGTIYSYVTSRIVVGNNFLNSNLLTFDAQLLLEGWLEIDNSFYNFDTVRGNSGYIQVSDTSYNDGYFKGTFDFCDLTPPASAPFVDLNTGTIEAGITWCEQQNVEKNISVEFQLYPNPCADYLELIIDNQVEGLFAEIYNINGQKMFSAKILSAETIIYTGLFSPGIYLLRLQNNHQAIASRLFIVE